MLVKPADRDSLNPAFVAVIVAVGAVSINAPIVGAQGIETAFELDRGAAALVLGSFAIGYGIGHLMIGLTAHLLSWRLILIVSLAGYSGASYAAAISSSMEGLQLARIGQGVFAAAAPILGRAMVRTIQHRGEATKLFTTAFALFAWAPVIVPLGAGLLIEAYNWRAVFWALLIYAGCLLTFLIFCPPKQIKKKPAPANAQYPRWGGLLRNKETLIGLVVAVLAFACFFIQLALVDEHQDTGLHISIIVTLIASSFAIGGTASRLVLSFVSCVVALRTWASSILFFALAGFASIIATHSAWTTLLLTCLTCICAGAITPIATFLSMGENVTTAPRTLALLGAVKMGISGMIAYAISVTTVAPLITAATVTLGFALMAGVLCFRLSDGSPALPS